jgi:flagellar biosynthesis protein FlhG
MHDQAERMRELARRMPPGRRPDGPYVIAVTSGKGGVGKSTVALALGYHLAGLGSRVLLVDTDANLAGLDVMLGIKPGYRLSHILRGDRDIEETLLSPAPGLHLLPGSSGEPDYPVLTPDRQDRLLQELRSMEEPHEFLILDTAAGLTGEVVRYAVLADEVLVVTTPEPTSVVDAYAMVKVVWSLQPEAVVRLLINSAPSPPVADGAAVTLRRAVRQFLGRNLDCLGSIPRDPQVVDALTRQTPLVQAAPFSGASLSLRALAVRFMEESARRTERRYVEI